MSPASAQSLLKEIADVVTLLKALTQVQIETNKKLDNLIKIMSKEKEKYLE